MNNIITLTKRELLAFFFSIMAYVIMFFFSLFSGYFFYIYLRWESDTNALRHILDLISITTLIITPMITMRLLAEEKKSGTLEMLMTAPVTETQIVLSKFIATMVFYLFLIVPMVVAYTILLGCWGNPEYGSIITGYSGLILLAGVFISIGLFISSFTADQIVAAIVTFVLLLMGWVAGYVGQFLPLPFDKVFEYIGFFDHFGAFRKGLVDTRDLIYFVSLIVFFLFLTVRSLESRRWR